MTRRPAFAVGTALLGVIATIASIIILFQTPVVAQQHVETALQDFGFKLPPDSIALSKFGSLEYRDIALDQEGFSTIKSLKIEYGWFNLLMFGQLTNTIVEGLNLTGELDENNNLSIAGWHGQTKEKLLSHLFTARAITFKNAQISLFSNRSGGISISYDGEMIQNKEGFSFRGKLENTQKQMRYTANINGQINRNLSWYGNIELEDIHIQTKDAKITRATGQIKVTKNENEPNAVLNGEIHAGQIALGGFPWTKTSMTIQGTPAHPGLIIGSKAIGFDNVEMGMALRDINNSSDFSGYIYSTKLSDFFDYMNHHSALPVSREVLRSLDNLGNTEISFERHDDDWEIDVKNDTKHLDFKGFFHTKEENGRIMLLGAAFKNTAPGTLKIENPAFFKLLEASPAEKEKIRTALKNMPYNEITIEMKPRNGPGNFSFRAEIKGANTTPPLNLSLKADMETLATILLK